MRAVECARARARALASDGREVRRVDARESPVHEQSTYCKYIYAMYTMGTIYQMVSRRSIRCEPTQRPSRARDVGELDLGVEELGVVEDAPFKFFPGSTFVVPRDEDRGADDGGGEEEDEDDGDEAPRVARRPVRGVLLAKVLAVRHGETDSFVLESVLHERVSQRLLAECDFAFGAFRDADTVLAGDYQTGEEVVLWR